MQKQFPIARISVIVGLALGASWPASAQVPAPAATAAANATAPNIVIFLADDMGFSDIAPYGGEIRTPNLTRLAASGIKFTQFYNTGRCCPTRAALLTGLYSHEAGVGHMTDNEIATRGPGYGGRLNEHACTLAELLKTAGYSTWMVGKWHVSNGEKDQADWPMQRGFDRFFGSLAGPKSYFDSPAMINGNTMLPTLKGTYSTYLVSDTAAGYIDRHAASGGTNPFFLYVAHNAPHWPLQAPDSLVAKYKGTYLKGWSALRKERLARQRASGLIDPTWPLSPDDGLEWDSLSAAKREELDLRMAIYAAQIEAMDQGIGTVLAALDRNGLRRNTLVFFLSDNGGNLEGGLSGGGPAADLGKHQTEPALSYGQSWANASNTPFREYKHYEFEGGIATPLLVSWPAAIADTNRWDTHPGHVIDLMATVVEVSGAKYPASLKGNSIYPMEGVSLVPSFTGNALNRGKPLFWEHEGNRAVRDGKWKLVALKGKPWELHDMVQDRSEMDDLAAANPILVKTMSAAWDAWAVRTFVVWNPTGIPGGPERKSRNVDVTPAAPAVRLEPGVRANGARLPVASDAGAAKAEAVPAGVEFRLPAGD
ncbi:MAG: Choline-sulfatase [Fibrobacteres bacterium]|nr:Choline-sulfatase [Fibrobacterota bacterium]